MSCDIQVRNLCIKRGTTFSLPVRWQDSTLTYKSITAITQSGPVRLTVPDHGCPDGWESAAMNAGGMREINAEENPPADFEMRITTVVDSNTVEFNSINSAGFRAYTSGGQLVFYAPKSLTGYTARCQFRDAPAPEGAVLYSPDVTIDTVGYVVTLTVPAADSETFNFTTAVYDLELVDASGIVVATLLMGDVEITPEVTAP